MHLRLYTCASTGYSGRDSVLFREHRSAAGDKKLVAALEGDPRGEQCCATRYRHIVLRNTRATHVNCCPPRVIDKATRINCENSQM